MPLTWLYKPVHAVLEINLCLKNNCPYGLEGSNPSTGINPLYRPHEASFKLKIAVKHLLQTQVFSGFLSALVSPLMSEIYGLCALQAGLQDELKAARLLRN
jgi:hypothetical protein